VFLLSPAASFISGTVMRMDGARPQVRMGWGQVAAPEEVQQRDAVKPLRVFIVMSCRRCFSNDGLQFFLERPRDPGADAPRGHAGAHCPVARARRPCRTSLGQVRPGVDKRGQLLPRERVALLLDPGTPYLPLCSLAGFMQDTKDPLASVPGGGMVAGIGFISGVRCMVVASDSGIEAGAIQAMGLEKILRVQEIALQNKLPFVHLVESAGANLMRYRVEGFVHGGSLFRNLARLSAAGLPVITVQHGSGTAGGAYMPGLSDVVIMVRGRSRAFLAGPPLLMAATGEVATEEELGGAEMHTSMSGLGEYLAEDDRHALGMAREVLARTGFAQTALQDEAKPPRFDTEELLGLMPPHHREPVDMREVIARLVDDSDLLEFKPLSGSATVCAQASMGGHRVGIISNNGPIDVAGANKATHFIQMLCQLGQPIIYLQNTTGYMVGKDSEQGGMIKHGSKMIQAVTNATVPQITIQCGASFGAGNYGMCGRAMRRDFCSVGPAPRRR
jgi:geranyl-CoA carboxylase beta subunit